MQRLVFGRVSVPRWAAVLLTLLIASVSPVAAQTEYTWTGNGSNTDWLTAANWAPTGGPPGVPGSTGEPGRGPFRDRRHHGREHERTQ